MRALYTLRRVILSAPHDTWARHFSRSCESFWSKINPQEFGLGDCGYSYVIHCECQRCESSSHLCEVYADCFLREVECVVNCQFSRFVDRQLNNSSFCRPQDARFRKDNQIIKIQWRVHMLRKACRQVIYCQGKLGTSQNTSLRDTLILQELIRDRIANSHFQLSIRQKVLDEDWEVKLKANFHQFQKNDSPPWSVSCFFEVEEYCHDMLFLAKAFLIKVFNRTKESAVLLCLRKPYWLSQIACFFSKLAAHWSFVQSVCISSW